eukprot:2231799-Rhodomonas_salina.1
MTRTTRAGGLDGPLAGERGAAAGAGLRGLLPLDLPRAVRRGHPPLVHDGPPPSAPGAAAGRGRGAVQGQDAGGGAACEAHPRHCCPGQLRSVRPATCSLALLAGWLGKVWRVGESGESGES